jgi:type IV pilus assembly protein PilY1
MKHHHKITPTLSLRHSALLCLSLSLPVLANTQVDMAQAPMEKAIVVDPNMLIILDDSGSMKLDYMPDALQSQHVDTRKTVGVNTIFFDPTRTYTIPRKPDGTRFPVPSFWSAPSDGFNQNSKKINLATPEYFEKNPACSWGDITNLPPQGSCYIRKWVTDSAMQANYAIWYSFYRTRLLLAKSALTEAFFELPENFRVGYFRINNRSENYNFGYFRDNKIKFLTWLQDIPETQLATPLMPALKAAGDFFENKKEVWYDKPSDLSSKITPCRRSVALMMTDGVYNGTRVNTDSGDNKEHKVTGAKQWYKPIAPFVDNASDTMADLAIHYWKRDLRPEAEFPNTLPMYGSNIATWQHMTTYTVGLGVDGSIGWPDVERAVAQKSLLAWGDPRTDKINDYSTYATERMNDLVHAAANTHGKYFSAKDPEALRLGMLDLINSIQLSVASQTSLGATSLNSLSNDNFIYQASYTSANWSGDLLAFDANDASVDANETFQKPKWRASDTVKDHTKRNIFYYSLKNSRMQAFTWGNFSTETDALAAFKGDKDTNTIAQQRLNYIRGDRSNEAGANNSKGIFRERGTSILGDIVNSDPVLVGTPTDMNYQRYSWGAGYRKYLDDSAIAFKTPMIYVSANDGMVHAFNAENGTEVFAYIPQSLFKAQSAQKPQNLLHHYSSFFYKTDHRFLLDGANIVADVQISGSWQKVLIGGNGRGGNNIFALNITDPLNPTLLWDKDSSSIGSQIGKPKVVRLNDNKWYLLYGSGFNTSLNSPALILVDIASGAEEVIDTKAGSATKKGSGTDVAVVDINQDGNTDLAYMGDSFGNVWKFELSDQNNLKVARLAFGRPLFTATSSDNKPQTISGGITAAVNPADGHVWLFFGTGRYVALTDHQEVPTSAQSMYGIKDGTSVISGRGDLQKRNMQTFVLPEDVRLFDELDPNDTNFRTKRGWYMDFSDNRERVVDAPQMISGKLMVNSRIPDNADCNPLGNGWVMVFDGFTGTRFKQRLFDVNLDGKIDASDDQNNAPVSGFMTSTQNSKITIGKNRLKQTVGVETTNIAPRTRLWNLDMDLGRQSWSEVTR